MSIFTLHSSVIEDYRDFVRSFFTVADDRAREFIDGELVEQARLWPEALLQVSPSYARVGSLDELGSGGLRAELDAWSACAYGLTQDELRYILDPADVYAPNFRGETLRVLKERRLSRCGHPRSHHIVLEAWNRVCRRRAAATWIY